MSKDLQHLFSRLFPLLRSNYSTVILSLGKLFSLFFSFLSPRFSVVLCVRYFDLMSVHREKSLGSGAASPPAPPAAEVWEESNLKEVVKQKDSFFLTAKGSCSTREASEKNDMILKSERTCFIAQQATDPSLNRAAKASPLPVMGSSSLPVHSKKTHTPNKQKQTTAAPVHDQSWEFGFLICCEWKRTNRQKYSTFLFPRG